MKTLSIPGRCMVARASLLVLFLLVSTLAVHAAKVSGVVSASPGGAPIGSARVTLFTPNLRFFREVRTNASGGFEFRNVPSGTYQIGASALGREYREMTLIVSAATVTSSLSLGAETNGGRWTIIGNTEPELIGYSGSGNLLPTGETFFCHDTQDPMMFDSLSLVKWYPPDSLTAQGCHMVTLNTGGGMFLTGGSMGGQPQNEVVKIAKTYWRNTNSWSRNADMNIGRWYPGLVRLPDERLLIMGGEQPGAPGRTNTCEIYNPVANTWTMTGSMNLPTEMPPALLLFSGEVFKTWRYPELYNIGNGTWRAAANMVQARQGQTDTGHSDHEIVYLPDGRVMAVGVFPLALNASTRFCEFYNPASNTWSLGPNPRALRGQPEALILPDGRVLSFGGEYSGPSPAPVPLAPAGFRPNCTKVADLYDPATNAWRAMADLNRFIHYHNVTVLAPDGRVIATGGAGLTTARNSAGDDSSIEAFEPPYLFRGVRPRIDSLSTTDFAPGSTFTLQASLTTGITKLVLVSARTVTHWVDGGPQRFLSLDFTQNGAQVGATIPNDPVRALAGWYILFAMVDDIPSVGRMVRITPAPALPLSVPNVSITATMPNAGEGGGTGVFTFTRTGDTTAPFTIAYAVSGSSENGADFAPLLNYVTFGAGQTSVTVNITPIDDSAAEGPESVTLTLFNTASYRVSGSGTATVALIDNEPPPPPLALTISSPAPGQYQLTLTGPRTRRYIIESSSDLQTWQPFTDAVNTTGSVELVDFVESPQLFFRARTGDVTEPTLSSRSKSGRASGGKRPETSPKQPN